MHQAYSLADARAQGASLLDNLTRQAVLARGKKEDWGKTAPFWCLDCGQGFVSIKRVLAHYANAGHGNESMSVGARGLTKERQHQAFRLRNK